MTADQADDDRPRTRGCDYCGTPYLMPLRRGGRQQMYCRRSCRQRAYEARQRDAEIGTIQERHQQQLDRVLGTLAPGAATQAREAAATAPQPPGTRKGRKAVRAAEPQQEIAGQEELTW
ncbi:hypothetical protein [Kitasatospora griseola]|uniref:hypothetical protein n=1 Tax=Kitasatospora griseola TaxID=2064 RepID=UPI0038180CFC